MTLKHSFLPIIFMFFSFFATSQTIRKKPIPLVKYLENVEAPFTTNELKMLKEVYKEKFEDYVINDLALGKALKHLLRNRIEIKEIPEFKNVKKYKNLSTITLDNDDPSIRRDGTFNKDSFNPLRYKVQFFSKQGQLFKIENTGYYLVVKPQR